MHFTDIMKSQAQDNTLADFSDTKIQEKAKRINNDKIQNSGKLSQGRARKRHVETPGVPGRFSLGSEGSLHRCGHTNTH